jgi:hypothetical protein
VGSGVLAGVAGVAVMTVAEKLEQAVTRRPDSGVRRRMWAMHVGMAAGSARCAGVMAFAAVEVWHSSNSGYGDVGVGPMVQGLPLVDELSVVFARMSGLLLSEETVGTAVGLVTALATDAIPGTVGAGVTLVDERGAKTTSGASDPVVEKADTAQYELDEGPCLTAWAQRALVRIDDIGSDGRWPRWSRAVEPLGLRAALSAPLVAGDRSLGAVKVYAATGRLRPARGASAGDVRRAGGDTAGQRAVGGQRPAAQRGAEGRAA